MAVTSAGSLSCLIFMRVGCLLHQRVQYLLGSIEMSHASMEISHASIDFGPLWLGREAKAVCEEASYHAQLANEVTIAGTVCTTHTEVNVYE